MQPNHAALIIPGIERIGGAESQILVLARGLRRRGWRVTVVVLTGNSGQQGGWLAEAGIGFVSLHMRKGVADPRGWIQFDRWLGAEQPAIVHAHLHHAIWMARWARLRRPEQAVVDTLHSTCTGDLGRRLGFRASNWLAGLVTAVSQPVAEGYLAAGLVDAGKLRILPNGVDTEHFRPDVKERESLRQAMGVGDGFLWVAVGRMAAVKDYPTMLAALRRLPRNASLAIAGDGPLAAQMRTLACQMGLTGRVRFLGFIPDVSRYLQAADGLVVSSHWEGLPLAVLEAGACSLPTVATDVPGLRESVEEGRTGLLAASSDAQALAQVMDQMMRMPASERQTMGRNARSRVVELYSLEAVLDRWEDLYAECRARMAANGAQRWLRVRPLAEVPLAEVADKLREQTL